MITTIIICITVVLCLVILLKWITDMSKANLPMFTWGQCEWVSSTSEPAHNPIGFESKPEEVIKEPNDKEELEHILRDSASTISALLRGEVDFDDIKH